MDEEFKLYHAVSPQGQKRIGISRTCFDGKTRSVLEYDPEHLIDTLKWMKTIDPYVFEKLDFKSAE